MNSREAVTALLNQVEVEIKDLDIAYENYFTGVERVAPEKARQALAKQFRKLLTTHVTQNDLRFRLNSLSARFQSYSGRWDRILRMIDEGRYERHVSKMKRRLDHPEPVVSSSHQKKDHSHLDHLYNQLANAHTDCSMQAPSREQVSQFLDKQKDAIQKKFGDKDVGFKVVTENGRPKVKVFAR